MDTDVIQKLALAVDPPDEDFDPDLQPETGEQYLQKVMYERKKCPSVVVVRPSPKRRLQASGSGIVPASSVRNRAHRMLIPTKEWEAMQIQKFAELRDTITGYRNSAQYQENLQRTQIFLCFENRKQLHEYCANNQPFVRILLSIPQRNLEILLEYLFEWLQGDGESQQEESGGTAVAASSEWITQWIYAILACIITPLEPYVHSVLRDIAKTCIAARNELTAEDELKVLPLNLLICIISKNFHQLDLSDNSAL
ncbi:survival motor neuron-interacting protein 1 [Culex quinquefasciatus]|uniref:Gem-associated protein 2 n=1 Tax=Culex quinquefasciatus TaxID=7176 RepID=B0VZF3_CULQU|nr:protein Gemin2 isoform X1 [Culex pipiens pallens]EDS31690.1 survival motor neuron-interacting protein 1 [Culex quinquefasciatus]|eukprot:XP_001841837.1 survival motor neuron-interacting protein 1 [Culex quinquefasciatus]